MYRSVVHYAHFISRSIGFYNSSLIQFVSSIATANIVCAMSNRPAPGQAVAVTRFANMEQTGTAIVRFSKASFIYTI